jgi:tripartite-type tricarboxylate transporter receptor subunit TctC
MKASVSIIALLLVAPAAQAIAAATERYPDRPVRFVLPFAAGSPSDIVARLFGSKLAESLGQPMVNENRAGAAGVIAAEIAARAPANGYTLMLGTVGILTILPNLSPGLPYDPVRDFAPVSQLSASPYLLAVNLNVPAKSIKELVALARAKPGQLNFAAAGPGTGNHLAGELFRRTAAIDIVHVSYKGATEALPDIISGRVQIWVINLLSGTPQVKAGRIRALAVTSAKRSSVAPDIPTVAEAGYEYETTSWHGILAPAKTPAHIIRRLQSELARIAQQPDVRTFLIAQGADPIANTPEEFAAVIKGESARWGKLIKAAGVKAE